MTRQISKLRDTIQQLCRSANPLGRTMDYVQEDIDSMFKELEMWRKETTEKTEAYNEQMRYRGTRDSAC